MFKLLQSLLIYTVESLESTKSIKKTHHIFIQRHFMVSLFVVVLVHFLSCRSCDPLPLIQKNHKINTPLFLWTLTMYQNTDGDLLSNNPVFHWWIHFSYAPLSLWITVKTTFSIFIRPLLLFPLLKVGSSEGISKKVNWCKCDCCIDTLDCWSQVVNVSLRALLYKLFVRNHSNTNPFSRRKSVFILCLVVVFLCSVAPSTVSVSSVWVLQFDRLHETVFRNLYAKQREGENISWNDTRLTRRDVIGQKVRGCGCVSLLLQTE